ncbi:MAG: hypothetical protein NTU72_00385 [Fimbriimonadales bacterium]|nr:hypothetical protein [Fimbriimonadales bacterium]
MGELLGSRDPLNILIIEDYFEFVVLLERKLLELGHRVISASGVSRVEGDSMVLHSFSSGCNVSSFGLLTGCSEGQSIPLSWAQVCFLDHYFRSDAGQGVSLDGENNNGSTTNGCNYNGTTLTPVLVAGGVRVIGMSSRSSANARMRSLGAETAMVKRELEHLLLFS